MVINKSNIKSSHSVSTKVAYPKFIINRGTIAESSRRNITIIAWYKRLINVTLALLSATSFFTFMSFIFALLQPLPELYSTSLDGSLKQVLFVRTQDDPGLTLLRESLLSEQVSRQSLMTKTPIQKIVSAASANLYPPALPETNK